MSRNEIRYSTYKGSEFVEDLTDHKVNYEVTSIAEEWKYVERAMKHETIPEPIKKSEYTSGWKPQAENLKDRPYFIERTKNHMIPVYMDVKQRGMKRLTYIKKIKGDIWKLENELKEFLQKNQVKPIRSQVNEFVGYICFHGDHVNAVKYWLMQKDF